MSRSRGNASRRKRSAASAPRAAPRSAPRQRREIEALLAVVAVIGRRGDLALAGEETLDVVRALTGMPVGALYRFDRARDALVVVAQRGLTPEQLELLRVRPVGESRLGAAVLAGQFTVVSLEDEPPRHPRLRAMIQEAGHRTQLTLPIPGKDGPWGAMALVSPERRTFDAEEVRLLEAVAQQVGLAVENADLFVEARQRAAEYRALFEVGALVSHSLEVEHVLEVIVERSRVLLDVAAAGIFRLDPATGVCVYERGSGLSPAFIRTLRVRPGEGTTGKAVAQREPVWSADVLTDATLELSVATRALVEQERYRAALSVPILMKGEAYGALAVYWWESHEVKPSEVELLSALAGQAAIAIENARLYQEARAQAARLGAIADLGRILVSTFEVDRVLELVGTHARETLGFANVGICLYEESTGVLRFVAGAGFPAEFVETYTLAPGEGVAGRAFAEGRPVWTASFFGDQAVTLRPDSRRRIAPFPNRAVLALPLMRERPFGCLVVHREVGHRFTAEEIEYLSTFASLVAVAIENARLYAETNRLARQTQAKLQETETLLAVSRTLASTLDLDSMPRHFLRHMVQSLGADTAGLWLVDETGQWMVPLAGYHVPPRVLEKLRGVRLSITEHGFYAEAAETRRCVVSTDVSNDPRFPAEMRAIAPQRTQVFVPIVAKDRVVGGLAATWWERERVLSQSERQLMEAVANQAGVALENARLFRDHQQRAEELSVLHELSQAVTGRLDQAELIDTIHHQVARVLDVQHMVIILHDEERDELAVALRIEDGARADHLPRRYPPRHGLMSVVLQTGRPIRTEDYAGECLRHGVSAVQRGGEFPRWLGVPMVAGNRTLGVLALRSRDRAFTERDERLLANIAQLAALALRSARLFEERSGAFTELAAAQDQLVRTEKLRALGEMASGVAHDFNNLLASIVGRAQLLLREVQEPRHRRWIEVIERSALDGAQTVRRLQEFTRIRRDQAFVVVDLNRVVQEALEVTESRWRDAPRGRGIAVEVKTSLTAALPPVSGDPAELREALTNLILNALDAMPEGGQLTLSTSAAIGQVGLAVTDTGVGIPEQVRPKIFDPFFTTKGPQGTGLGLSMTYGILSRHGAQVVVESEEGRGTTFRLTFPVSTAPTPPPPEATLPAPVRPLRCLVVDDEAVVGDVLGDILLSAGHGVAVVREGAAAVSRFRDEPFDVVFTDLSMPGFSGWEVARAIKALAPDVTVFLVTGFGVELSPDEMKGQGVDAVLAKPLRISDILGALAAVRPRA